ncbi:MAG: LptF/LptG family permease [Bacteroidales bacterium]|nr:LptF/LptG family permease [Bacteroidales bacterium]
MKKLDRLILRSFLGPLVLTFAVAIFVLLMQFLWKYIDDLVGKGLDFSIIAELMLYASATFVPMALPIAILFASIMTMGNFGERYELVAMKAGGVSIGRVMAPMAVVVLMLTGVAFYFANNVMPTAMLRYRMTLYDVTRKKPAVNIRPGEYYKDIDGYVIRVGSKDNNTGALNDIVVYDHSNGIDETTVTVAASGFMRSSPDNNYLFFTLHNGYTYSESNTGEDFNKRPLTSIQFDEQTITFDISSFAFNRSAEDLFSGSYQMMNIAQLDTTVRRLEEQYATHRTNTCNEIKGSLHAWMFYIADSVPRPAELSISPEQETRRGALVHNMASSTQKDIKLGIDKLHADREYISRHHVVWQRKYTMSLACLLLFLVGAPFGSIVRKGGLGLPLVASVLFFVLYYVVDMIDEKSVRSGVVGPEGMWVSSLVLLPIGLLLTVQATSDSSLLDPSTWRRMFRALLARLQGR